MRTGFLIAWLTSFALAGAVNPCASADSKLPVVATFSILADMAGRVGGERVSVRALVGPEQDAHVFEASPAASAELADAQVVISNGLGFEGWIDRLIASSGYKGSVVVASLGVKPLTSAEGGHAEPRRDPHAWQDLNNALIYVGNIERGLCAADRAGCALYAANAKAYSTEIVKLDARIKADIAAVQPEKRKVITSHDAFAYFAEAYATQFLAPVGLSTSSEASAQGVAALIDQIKREKVTALFVENISDGRLLEQIARETQVRLGGVLYSDALSKPGGPAATYLDMMSANARALIAAMKQP